MKTIYKYLILMFLTFAFSCSNDDDQADQMTMEEMEETANRTLIPDIVFEEYLISLRVDDVVDGSVISENLLLVEEIVVNNLEISDLTGIEDCPNLFNLWLQDCKVSSLDVSNNPKLQFIYFDNNNVSTLDVSDLPLLEKLSGRNNNLTDVDVSNNGVLELLEVSGNAIENIDVSTNAVLFRFDISENPLACIQVNEDQLGDTNLQWTLDEDDTLALDCE